MEDMIASHNLSKRYGEQTVVDDLTVTEQPERRGDRSRPRERQGCHYRNRMRVCSRRETYPSTDRMRARAATAQILMRWHVLSQQGGYALLASILRHDPCGVGV
jgi:hypothetical protein